MTEADDDDHMVGTKAVRIRYGNCCKRTIDRWIDDPEMDFPKPTMINGRRYWRLCDLRQWERARAADRVSA
jgi:hypothetical protein